jgi:radical SAM protein with 4Fe4S-binding SPASM domain
MHMGVSLFEQFIEKECAHVAAVGLHHFGEPFLNPNLDKYVAICKACGVETTISTNATHLPDESVERVIRAGLTRLIISLDAADAETYQRLRVGGNFAQVRKNIDSLLRAKSRIGREPFVQVQFIQTPENEGQWERFRVEWENKPGVDQVVLRDERNHAGQRVRHSAYRTRSGVRLPCRYLWESLVVLADGRIVPCCKDYDGREVLGNVFAGDTLEGIWNGDRMRALREAHVQGRFEDVPLCASCAEWPGHEAMEELDSMKAFSEFKTAKKLSRLQNVHRRDFE